MAWFHMLAIEHGDSMSDARAMRDELDGLAVATAHGARHVFTKGWTSTDALGHAWSIHIVDGVSETGSRDPADVRVMERAAGAMRAALASTRSPYRWALVGIETEHFAVGLEELAEHLADSRHARGLVLSLETWEATGEPAGFVPFAPGHVWLPTCVTETNS